MEWEIWFWRHRDLVPALDSKLLIHLSLTRGVFTMTFARKPRPSRYKKSGLVPGDAT